MKNLAAAIEQAKEEFEHVGFRFESKIRNKGDVIEDVSKRLLDTRDFPEFGSEEYDELDDLNGASAWDCDFAIENINFDDAEIMFEKGYLIGSDDREFGEDEGELVMIDPVVIEVLF